jgi:glycerophosphoryl diester phosphodiesterase
VRVLVIAHRGASGYRPEHTLAAYELAIEMGADFIEPDLVPTRDGVLIARHENEISETTDVASRPEFADRRTTRRIDGAEVAGWFTEDFTLAEIKTLRARERLSSRDQSWNGRFEVPTLAEVLDLARRKSAETGRTIGVYPETKHPSYFRSIGLPLEEPLVEALHAAGYRGREGAAFIQSFETGNLRDLRRITDLPLIQLLDDTESYRELTAPEGLARIAGYAAGIGPNKRLILEGTSLVEDAHRAGLLVHPWTFRSDAPFLSPVYQGKPEREYEHFFSLGVDGVFSDFPDVAVRVARALKSRAPEEVAMNLDVRQDRKERKFYTSIEGQEAKIEYAEGVDGTLNLLHTFVPEELRGRGIAAELVRQTLDRVRREGGRIVASCPYIQAFLEKHPEYQDLAA